MKQLNVQGRYAANDLSNYNQNNFVLYNKDYNRTNKISTSKAKTKNNLKNQFALNTKFSRYNSADKYKLSNYKSKPLLNKFDEIVNKSKKVTSNQMNFYPNQINININNYNFSNYNNKSLNQRVQNASNTQTDSRLSNIIQNNNNSPAYIEIINPIPNKSSTNLTKEKEKYNSFNRAANKQPSSFKNSNINFNQIDKLSESNNREKDKPALISNSTTQLPRTAIDPAKKIIINKSLQKKIFEINQTSTNNLPDPTKKIKIGNLEIDNENESFFNDVINLFQDSNDNKKERYSSYKDEVNQKSPNDDKIKMPLIQMNKSKVAEKSLHQAYPLQGSLNDKNVYLDNVSSLLITINH